jgi:hypothetical protein
VPAATLSRRPTAGVLLGSLNVFFEETTLGDRPLPPGLRRVNRSPRTTGFLCEPL